MQTYYYLNDPALNMLELVDIPTASMDFQIHVEGYDFKPANIDTKNFHASNCYVSLQNCINYVNKMFKRNKVHIVRWAGGNVLNVTPVETGDINAYYSRGGMTFLTGMFKGKQVYTCDSSDIVTHETGHAFLDAIAGDLWGKSSIEICSMHEAFADITAIVAAMQYEKIIEKALSQTNNQLNLSNIISRVGEELGWVVFGEFTETTTLRDAVDVFKYVNPTQLPTQAEYNQLANECHSFGRVFVCAWYDILVGIFEREKTRLNVIDALKKASDVAYSYLITAVMQAPRTPRFYKAVAEGMMSADRANNNQYMDILKSTFIRRKIIGENLIMLRIPDVIETSDTHEKQVFESDFNKIVCFKGNKTIIPAEHAVMKLSENKFFNAEIEIPVDFCYEFDNKDHLIRAEVAINETEAIEESIRCAMLISATNKTINGMDMWEVKDKKVVRNFIQ